MNGRSYLFIPGNSAGMMVSSFVLDADVLIYDLEDAVSLDQKDSARHLVNEAVRFLPKRSQCWVRVNPLDSPYFMKDVDALIDSPIDAFLLPKCDDVRFKDMYAYIEATAKRKNVHIKPCVALIESATGVFTLPKLIKLNVSGLFLGAEDLSADMHMTRTKGSDEIMLARQQVVLHARVKGIVCIDTPFVDVDDMDGLQYDAIKAKQFGFDGKACIHPKQVSQINQLFGYSDEQLQWAQGVLDMAKKHADVAVFNYQGSMVDRPILLRAQHMVDLARKWGLIHE
ncbi:MAG TPA: CoA ester lyase [Erysipelotrichaceae bacterium]|nr:CoA ester lyase [Erysipelotrichaceae bacterium]